MERSKFKDIKYFNEYDNWGNIDKVSEQLVKTLDNLQSRLPSAFKILIAPNKDSVYKEIDKNNKNTKDILHNMGLAAKIFVSGSKLLTFMNMLQLPEIGNITIYPYDKWVEKKLICSFDIDIRTYNHKKKSKTIDYVDEEGNIFNCSSNYINLCELIDLLLYIDCNKVKDDLTNLGVR